MVVEYVWYTKSTMKDITDIINPILQKYGIKKAALFGSYARGDYDEKSDIDILIEAPVEMGLSFLSLKHDLEDTLQKKIDLVTYNGVSPYLKDDIFKNQIPLL